jgi:hypothetical protein
MASGRGGVPPWRRGHRRHHTGLTGRNMARDGSHSAGAGNVAPLPVTAISRLDAMSSEPSRRRLSVVLGHVPEAPAGFDGDRPASPAHLSPVGLEDPRRGRTTQGADEEAVGGAEAAAIRYHLSAVCW